MGRDARSAFKTPPAALPHEYGTYSRTVTLVLGETTTIELVARPLRTTGYRAAQVLGDYRSGRAGPLATWFRDGKSGYRSPIDPSSLWQNAWIESFNGQLQDELLSGWQLDYLLEAQVHQAQDLEACVNVLVALQAFDKETDDRDHDVRAYMTGPPVDHHRPGTRS